MGSDSIAGNYVDSTDMDRTHALTQGAETTPEQRHKAALTVASMLPKQDVLNVLYMLGLVEPKPSDEYVFESKYGKVDQTRVSRARCPECGIVKPLTIEHNIITHQAKSIMVPCESVGKPVVGETWLAEKSHVRMRGMCPDCKNVTWLDKMGCLVIHRPKKNATVDCEGSGWLPVEGTEYESNRDRHTCGKCPICGKAIRLDREHNYGPHDRKSHYKECSGSGLHVTPGEHEFHVLTRDRVRCLDCKRRIHVLADGTLPLHTTKDKGSTRCWGSGKEAAR